MGERILNKEEQAYKNMEAVCGILNALCKTDTVYTVGVTYLDFGQDWKWTTILNNKGVQILNPREWTEIEVATTANDLVRIVEGIRGDKYFSE